MHEWSLISALNDEKILISRFIVEWTRDEVHLCELLEYVKTCQTCFTLSMEQLNVTESC